MTLVLRQVSVGSLQSDYTEYTDSIRDSLTKVGKDGEILLNHMLENPLSDLIDVADHTDFIAIFAFDKDNNGR